MGRTTAPDSAGAAGMPTARIYGVLDALAEGGYVRMIPGRPKRYGPHEPAAIAERAVENRRHAYERFREDVEAVEEAFVGASVGGEGTVDVPADDAFGEYDRDGVETVKADKIHEDDRYPGAQVQIDGRQGRLETIIGGRARVDFNHPLAGEDLEYEYEIIEAIDDREEQASGMLGMYLQEAPEVRIETETEEEETVTEDDDGEETVETEEVEKDVLYVTATQAMQMNQQWMFQKQQIAQDLMDRLDLDRVVIEEVIEGGGMGGLGGMMGGMGGAGAGDVDIEEALEDVDVDADEIVDEIDEE